MLHVAMKTRVTPVLVGLAAALLCVAPAPAQEGTGEEPPPREQFEEETEVTEVLLDVVVTNREGDVVIGLDPDDFVVTENGERVPVETATFYSSATLAEDPETLAARGIEVDLEPADRHFILLFHDAWKLTTGEVNLMSQQARAGRDAKAWVKEDLDPADWVAVLSWDGSLSLHQDFTRDREALAAAIEEAASSDRGEENWPSRQGTREGPSLADDLPVGKALIEATPRIYDALELIAEASDDIRGRKNLIYFGVGFGDIGPFGQYREDPRFYPHMIRTLNDANVAVYPLDLVPSGIEHPFELALIQLAEATGGDTFPLVGSFKTPLQEIAKDTTGYYLLSYRATHEAGEEGFQRVRVTTENPQLQVRARRGYLYGEQRRDR